MSQHLDPDSKLSILFEFWSFLKTRKKWWLGPMSLFPFRLARGHYNADGYRLLSETIFSQIHARFP